MAVIDWPDGGLVAHYGCLGNQRLDLQVCVVCWSIAMAGSMRVSGNVYRLEGEMARG